MESPDRSDASNPEEILIVTPPWPPAEASLELEQWPLDVQLCGLDLSDNGPRVSASELGGKR